MTHDSTGTGAHLRELRIFSRATLHEAGRAAGVSCATVSNKERGFGKFTERQIAKLEKFYSQRISDRFERIVKLLEPEKS